MEAKIVSFNIRCRDDINGNSIAERAPRLFTVINPIDADIIGFQEYRPSWEEPIKHYFGKDYDMFCKYRSTNTPYEASPILWKRDKFDLLEAGYFWLSDTPDVESKGWDEKYDCFRMCVYTILRDKSTGTVFNVMNTHFGFGDNGQRASAKLIYERSKRVSALPTFVVGDFNMTPDSVGYAEMIRYFRDANEMTVQDRRGTYHGYDPEKTSKHIDYCFVDDKITPKTMRIIDELVDGKYPSDHFGLEITLAID